MQRQKLSHLEYFRRYVTSLKESQINKMQQRAMFLGKGGNGVVQKVLYKDKETVMKQLFQCENLPLMFREVRMMHELAGAGGVPRVLVVCEEPLIMVQKFSGGTYDQFMKNCTVGEFVDSLVSIAERQGEAHRRDIVHNDLKMNNITYSGNVDKPVFHISDLERACRVGQVPEKLYPDEDGVDVREEDQAAQYEAIR